MTVKTQVLPSGSHRKQVRDPLNPARRLSFTSPDPARVLGQASRVADVRFDLRHSTLAPEEAGALVARQLQGVVTVEQAWRTYEKTVKASWKKQARAIWAHRLAPTFGKLACVEVTESVMRTWEAEQLGYNLAPATVANAANVLRAMFNLQMRDGRLRGLPWGTYKPPRPEPRNRREACRSIEELQLLVIAAYRRDELNRETGRYADLGFRVVVMTLCGLRQGEAAGLGWADVNIDVPLPVLYVRRQALDGWKRAHPEWDEPKDPVKGKKAEVQRLHASAAAALRGQRENLESHGLYRPNGPVFPGRGGEWRTHADCIDVDDFRALVVDAGLPNPERWVVHSLRHSFGTLELVANGGDLTATQERMRHTNLRTLEGYLHETGRGLAQSRIPELTVLPAPPPPQLLPPKKTPPELMPFVCVTEEGDHIGDLVAVTTDAAKRAEDQRLERKRDARIRAKARYRGRTSPDYHKVYAEWDGEGVRPPAVTGHAERARQRARAAWLRGHPGDESAANARGQAAWRSTIASWASFLSKRRGGGQLALDPEPAERS
jgi:integrase